MERKPFRHITGATKCLVLWKCGLVRVERDLGGGGILSLVAQGFERDCMISCLEPKCRKCGAEVFSDSHSRNSQHNIFPVKVCCPEKCRASRKL